MQYDQNQIKIHLKCMHIYNIVQLHAHTLHKISIQYDSKDQTIPPSWPLNIKFKKTQQKFVSRL